MHLHSSSDCLYGVGSASLNVYTQPTCGWRATTDREWIHSTSAGSADGSVIYTIDANSSPNARNGIISIGTQVFSISQAAFVPPPCTDADWTWRISPADCPENELQAKIWTKINPACSGGITHRASDITSCTYVPSPCTDADWSLTISPSACPANSQQTYSWAKLNAYCSAGVSHHISETVSCTYTPNYVYSISPLAPMGAAGGTSSITVDAPAGCTWTLYANRPWIHLTRASGNGRGSVNYSLDVNFRRESRSGLFIFRNTSMTVIPVAQPAAEVVAPVVPQAQPTILSPSVNFLFLPPGTPISGEVTVKALLTDDVEVSQAVLYVDVGGRWVEASGADLYSHSATARFLLSTFTKTPMANGPHTIMVMAWDTAGNSYYATTEVLVNNPESGDSLLDTVNNNFFSRYAAAPDLSMTIWASRTPLNTPPDLRNLSWDTNGLMYAMGYQNHTALAAQWEGEGAPGQTPITLIGRRHGYSRGHGMLTPDKVTSILQGKKVWFVTRDQKVVEARIDYAITRLGMILGTDQDYTIIHFQEDLPESIVPMKMMTYDTFYQKYSKNAPAPFVDFRVSQFNKCAAGVPPFQYDTMIGGDSGSPNMLPMSDGWLVMYGGRTTSGPSPTMQADMDMLSVAAGHNPADYRLDYYDFSNYLYRDQIFLRDHPLPGLSPSPSGNPPVS